MVAVFMLSRSGSRVSGINLSGIRYQGGNGYARLQQGLIFPLSVRQFVFSFSLMDKMTSRDRVKKALNFAPVDRLPQDVSGQRAAGMTGIAYVRLRRYLGYPVSSVYIYDVPQQLALIEPEIMAELGGDTLGLERAYLHEDCAWQDWVLSDDTPCKIPASQKVSEVAGDWYLLAEDGRRLAVRRRGAPYFQQIYFPLAERDLQTDSFADIDEQCQYVIGTEAPTPNGSWQITDMEWQKFAAQARHLRATTTKAIIGQFGGSLFTLGQMLCGPERYLTALVQYPQAIERLTEYLLEMHLTHLEQWLKAVGQYLDVIVFEDDLGGQTAPFIAPATYRRFFKDKQALLWRRTHDLTAAKIMLHTCGAVAPLLDDLLEAGMDVLNPVQIDCVGMEPAELKRRYGGRLVFWGGACHPLYLLPPHSPQEVTAHARRNAALMQAGGGFVLQAPHNILPDAAPENVVALFKALSIPTSAEPRRDGFGISSI